MSGLLQAVLNSKRAERLNVAAQQMVPLRKGAAFYRQSEGWVQHTQGQRSCGCSGWRLTQTHHPGIVFLGMMYAPVVISTEVANTAPVTE